MGKVDIIVEKPDVHNEKFYIPPIQRYFVPCKALERRVLDVHGAKVT